MRLLTTSNQKSLMKKDVKKSIKSPKLKKKIPSLDHSPIKNSKVAKLKAEVLSLKKKKLKASKQNQAINNGIKPDNAAPFGVTDDMVETVLATLEDLRKEKLGKTKSSLLKEKDYLLLQVAVIKIPDVEQERRKYLILPHNIHGDDAEVCLFVKNSVPKEFVIRTPDERIDHTIDHYKEILSDHEVEGITTIMPSLQLKTEYDTYELQRNLVSRFDLFLCQGYLGSSERFKKSIGISFMRKNKYPLSVSFPKTSEEKPNLEFKKRMANALKTTWFYYKNHSDTYTIRIATVSHTREQIKENVIQALKILSGPDTVPGGVKNVRSLMLKTTLSKALPIYISLAPRNSIEIPVVKSKLPEPESVEGELSTMPGKKVVVLHTGDVFVNDDEDQEVLADWSDEDETPEDSTFYENDGKTVEEQSSTNPKKRKTPDDEESESSEDEAGDAENKYMKTWSKQLEDDDDDSEVEQTKKEPVKQKKKLKKQKTSSTQEKKQVKNGMKQKGSSQPLTQKQTKDDGKQKQKSAQPPAKKQANDTRKKKEKADLPREKKQQGKGIKEKKSSAQKTSQQANKPPKKKVKKKPTL